MARGRPDRARRSAIAFSRSLRPARGAGAVRCRPERRVVRLRKGRDQDDRRRRLGRCLEAWLFWLGVQEQRQGPESGVRPAPALCAGARKPALAGRLRPRAVRDPYQLDQHGQSHLRDRARRTCRLAKAALAQMGLRRPGAAEAGVDPADPDRASGGRIRPARAAPARPRPPVTDGRPFYQSARFQHVRRGCRSVAGQDVRPHARQRGALAGRIRGAGFVIICGDARGRPDRVRAGRLVQWRALRRQQCVAVDARRHCIGARGGGARLGRDRPQHFRHFVRARARSRQAQHWARTTPTATRSC